MTWGFTRFASRAGTRGRCRRLAASSLGKRWAGALGGARVGSEHRVALCDLGIFLALCELGIFAEEAADPASPTRLGGYFLADGRPIE